MATNVVASRPPERRPTATPTARANSKKLALHQHGVEFRQKFIGDIRNTLAASYDFLQRHMKMLGIYNSLYKNFNCRDFGCYQLANVFAPP